MKRCLYSQLTPERNICTHCSIELLHYMWIPFQSKLI
uniref:Uncharacterized protein n=1 Tax=Rhizophora mucronata TaxID=61149 RepID=A0A2P2MZ55_RHIMU